MSHDDMTKAVDDYGADKVMEFLIDAVSMGYPLLKYGRYSRFPNIANTTIGYACIAVDRDDHATDRELDAAQSALDDAIKDLPLMHYTTRMLRACNVLLTCCKYYRDNNTYPLGCNAGLVVGNVEKCISDAGGFIDMEKLFTTVMRD